VGLQIPPRVLLNFKGKRKKLLPKGDYTQSKSGINYSQRGYCLIAVDLIFKQPVT